MKNLNQLLLVLLLALPWILVAKAEDLPDLGERSATYISPKAEKKLGKEFMKEVRLNVPILIDPIINDYIQNLGDKLASNANAKNRKFHFFVVNDPTINAFAGPDANIGVNTGTITAVGSESELAAVIAHEIAHVSQHHIERLIRNAKITSMAAMAGALAAIIIGSTSNDRSLGNMAAGTAMASMGGAAQHMINFTREHEIEADNIGMRILYKSAFDPLAMPNFFGRMQRLYFNYTSDVPKFLLTHPVTSDRIAESKNRADKFPHKEIKSSKAFSLIRMRTQVLTSNNHPLNTIKQFQAKLNAKQQNSEELQYGYALALYQNLQFTQAAIITTDLQQKYPHEVLFKMLAAQLATENKQLDHALNLLKNELTNHSTYYPLIIQYGQTLIIAKQSQMACDFIRAKIRLYPNNSGLYRLLAEAYAQNNQIADAYQAKAKAYEIDGYGRQAALLLHQALKTPKLNTADRAIINARIDQLKEIEKEE